MGEERVALKDGVGRALVRRQPGDVVAVDQDLALVRLLEAGDHPQRRRLAAAARAEHREELALGDVEVDVVDGGEVAEALDDGRGARRSAGPLGPSGCRPSSLVCEVCLCSPVRKGRRGVL